MVNTLLTIVTLGIYYFWAKTRLRGYLFSQTEIEGDRFAYHGTARELLLGTLKAVLVFGVPIYLLNLVRDVLDVPVLVKVAAGMLSAVLFFVLFPVAMVGARRYRLGRTSWRGIRFSFRGRAWDMVKIFIVGSFFTGLTFGLYYPFFLVARQVFMVSHSYFGSERFDFSGRGWDLFWPYVKAILLTLPTLGLCWVWYVARKRRYFWDRTTLRPRALRLLRDWRPPSRPLGGERAPARGHARSRVALGARAEHPLRVPQPGADGPRRSRAHPAGGAARLHHGRGTLRLLRLRLRSRLSRVPRSS